MNLHADAVSVLTEYQPVDAQQRTLRDEFLAYLAEHPDAMTRESRPAHLTGSAMLVDPTGTRVLLNLHAKAKKWLQFGGHAEDGDSSLADTALRETREESGIDELYLLPGPVLLDRHPAPCGAEAHLDVMYVAISTPDAHEKVSEESISLGWFDPAALPEPTDDAVRRLARAAVARVRGG
ncbi:NUDIX domain-containing protein [Sporichthya sp.]|uniref:NUDIX hydrolase n=1 Tax=Sporichthya sp. TaxID=65475 RepID=UPI00180EFD47|nr:NUDIX domain-containing protein [Sporichthya sp.]MBA3741399.1 NUDIX domain-containing protein [Sporichthya sp.]